MHADSDSGSSRGITIAETTALQLSLRPLRRFLEDAAITELCINKPGEIFLESRAGWRREMLTELTYDWCLRFAKLVGNFTRQRVDASVPLLSAALPGGERVQIVLPPATSAGTVAVTIRRPSGQVWSIEELGRRRGLDAGT
jgi:type IV secretion system protein VirB11